MLQFLDYEKASFEVFPTARNRPVDKKAEPGTTLEELLKKAHELL